MPANVETMFSVRETPWHGLGNIIQDAPTSEDAIKYAGLDWDVITTPIMTNTGIEIPGYFANMRSDNNKSLGIVSKDYKIVQNREAFSFVDNILGGEVYYETAGSLAEGKRVWMLAHIGDHKVLGDEVKNYVLLSNSHDGKSAIKATVTPVRVVCQNTLNLALKSAQRIWSIRHKGDLATKIEEARRTLELSDVYMKNMNVFAEKMAMIKMSQSEVKNFVDTLFFVNEAMSKTITNNVEEMKEDFLLRYNNAPDIANFRGTKWGVIQALTDHRTHREAQRKTSKFSDTRMKEVIDGDIWLDNAIELLVA